MCGDLQGSMDILRMVINCVPGSCLSSWSLPWLCVGDFNEILDDSEKLGGSLRNDNRMRDFPYSLETCGLVDLGFVGQKFTWSNKQAEEISSFMDEGGDRNTKFFHRIVSGKKRRNIIDSIMDECGVTWVDEKDIVDKGIVRFDRFELNSNRCVYSEFRAVLECDQDQDSSVRAKDQAEVQDQGY
ncbi:hypothetical protein ACS0TY_017266 [Phlomoides rotata]